MNIKLFKGVRLKILTLLFLFVSFNLLAEEIGAIHQINSQAELAAVKHDFSEVNQGEELVINFEDNTQCMAPVKQAGEDILFLSFSNCSEEQKAQIKTGLSVEKSLFNLITLESQEEVAVFFAAEEDQEDTLDTIAKEGQEEAAAIAVPNTLPSKNESWYTLWGFGYSSITYDSYTQEIIDQLDNESGLSKMSISLDIFGFYWPLNNHKSMFGFIVNGSADRWSGPEGYYQVNQYLFGPSFHHFLGANIGSGWFVRADVGLAWYNELLDTSTQVGSSRSVNGTGTLVGVGYAVPLNQETRWLLNLNLARRSVGSASAQAINFSTGFLF